MTINEHYLVQLARQGNVAACSELYDQHYDAIYRYCYYHVGDVALAQDLTAEVFVQMVENLDAIGDHSRPFLTWLYAIARSVVALSLGEPQLVRLARQGDPAACSKLYDRYYDVIYRYCYYYVGNPAFAQNLAGEVFVQMAKQLDRFDEHRQPLLAWLYAMAYKLIADSYRRNKQRIQLPPADTSQSTFDKTRRLLTAEDLAVALTHLTEEQRHVILLQFVQDHSLAEVAHLMGKSEETLKSHPHLALAALQQALKEYPAYGQV